MNRIAMLSALSVLTLSACSHQQTPPNGGDIFSPTGTGTEYGTGTGTNLPNEEFETGSTIESETGTIGPWPGRIPGSGDDSTGSTDGGSDIDYPNSAAWSANVPGEPKATVVKITESGFEPANVTIDKGERVVFTNAGLKNHWPASDEHPSHEGYPGSARSKCGTPEQKNIFDACKGLPKGGEFSFTFLQTGTWEYHDHLNPKLTGTVTVR